MKRRVISVLLLFVLVFGCTGGIVINQKTAPVKAASYKCGKYTYKHKKITKKYKYLAYTTKCKKVKMKSLKSASKKTYTWKRFMADSMQDKKATVLSKTKRKAVVREVQNCEEGWLYYYYTKGSKKVYSQQVNKHYKYVTEYTYTK